jgi:hypothetical protein
MVAGRHDEGAKAYLAWCVTHLDISLLAAPDVQREIIRHYVD